jgi:uncharacterized protein (TIGR02996 family)
MSDEDALLAIAAQPEEDTPRLAYADWLDEHGRAARAEFIRVQIDMALKEATLSREELQQHADVFFRCMALMEAHSAEFLGPLAALPDGGVTGFSRGFVSAVQLSVHDFLTHAELIAAVRPLPAVGVKEVVDRLQDFLLCPHTGCVSRIQGWSEAFATHQVTIPNDLDLIDGIERLTRLERLDLGMCGINDLHCDLAFNYSLPALAELDLTHNRITDAGAENLLRTGLPKQLRRLVLDRNAITDRGATLLAELWPKGDANKLTHLGLARNQLTDAGRKTLRERFGDAVQF